MRVAGASLLGLTALVGCGDEAARVVVDRQGAQPRPVVSVAPPVRPPLELRINEVVSQNEGVWLDEVGETDDYVELFNPTPAAIALGDYLLFDGGGGARLPARTLASGERLLLWADGTPEEGELHLPIKVSSKGERLRLVKSDGRVVDEVQVPALAAHHAYARMPDGTGPFADCGWASPSRANGTQCGPREATAMGEVA